MKAWPQGERPGDRLRKGGSAYVPRSPVGWQTMLADLSLILFMVTAAAMAEVPDKQDPSRPTRPSADKLRAAGQAAPAISEPLAIWRPAPGGPPLALWLAEQQGDNRQLLSITLRYPPAAQQEALRLAGQMAAAAGAKGARARIVIEPAPSAGRIEAVAALAYDKGPA